MWNAMSGFLVSRWHAFNYCCFSKSFINFKHMLFTFHWMTKNPNYFKYKKLRWLRPTHLKKNAMIGVDKSIYFKRLKCEVQYVRRQTHLATDSMSNHVRLFLACVPTHHPLCLNQRNGLILNWAWKPFMMMMVCGCGRTRLPFEGGTNWLSWVVPFR